MKDRGIGLIGFFLVAMTLALATAAELSAGVRDGVSMEEFIRETQRISSRQDAMNLVWWVPVEYWSVALSGASSPGDIDEITGALKDYTLVVAVSGRIGSFGGVYYDDAQTVRSKIRLRDGGGNDYRPLTDSSVSMDARNLLSAMKPVLANMLGPMGENMHFLAFPALGKDGSPIANPYGSGSFSIVLGEEDFRFRLPMGSLLEPRVCPTCGEKLSGAYGFCPFDGAPLDGASSAAPQSARPRDPLSGNKVMPGK